MDNRQNGFLYVGGCREGDPISTYLFLLCVEILGIVIRENKHRKGIFVNNVEHKLSQNTDDPLKLSTMLQKNNNNTPSVSGTSVSSVSAFLRLGDIRLGHIRLRGIRLGLPPSRGHPSRPHPSRGHPSRPHPSRGHPSQGHPSRPSSVSGTSVSGASVSAPSISGTSRLRDCEGQDEWHRRIFPRWKDMKTEGPSLSAFHLGSIRLCLSSLPSVFCNSTQVNIR